MKKIVKVIIVISIIFTAGLSYVVYDGYKARVASRVLVEVLTVGIPEYIDFLSTPDPKEHFQKEAIVNSPLSSAKINASYSIEKSNNNTIIKITSGPNFISGKVIIVSQSSDGLWRCNKGSFIDSFYIGPCRDHERIPHELVRGL